MAVEAKPPSAVTVLTSAWIPAPPDESDPATMRTRPRGSMSTPAYVTALPNGSSDAQGPLAPQEHAAVHGRACDVIADERRPDPEQVVPEEAREQPRER